MDLSPIVITTQITILKVLRSSYLRKLVLFCLTQYYSNWFVSELRVSLCVCPKLNTFCRADSKCYQFKVIKIYQVTLFSFNKAILKLEMYLWIWFILPIAHSNTEFYWAWLFRNVVNVFSMSCFFWSIYKVSPWRFIFILMKKCA